MRAIIRRLRRTLRFCDGVQVGFLVGVIVASLATARPDEPEQITMRVLSDDDMRMIREENSDLVGTVHCTVYRDNGVPFSEQLADNDPIAATLRSRVPQ